MLQDVYSLVLEYCWWPARALPASLPVWVRKVKSSQVKSAKNEITCQLYCIKEFLKTKSKYKIGIKLYSVESAPQAKSEG